MSAIKDYWMDLQEEEERLKEELDAEQEAGQNYNPACDWDYDALYRDAVEDDPEATWGREW